ncbi:MAG: hypothetical protein LBL21_03090 [Rickettsiales bacterium]|jgi:hypothetical protein|nr:hypothetical protein [Rickettsiales bacterium]
MEKFHELAGLYEKVLALMSAVCVEKGGIDIDNYSGRFFAADLLELVVAFGEAAAADVAELRAELESKRDNLTPTSKPIYEMSLAEFEKLVAPEEAKV